MGQRQSTLQKEELIYFTKNTPCNLKYISIKLKCITVSSSEIKRLYRRFQQLDRQSQGCMVTEDLLSVPELAMNPLSKHLLDFILKATLKKYDEGIEEKQSNGMDFEDFVDVMSVFHNKTPLEIKFKCNYIIEVEYWF